MKKSLFFVAALLLSSMAFAEMKNCTIDIKADSLAKVHEWKNSKSYLNFNLDSLISVHVDTTYDAKTGAVAEGQSGVYYEANTSPADWRMYQARTDSFILEAADGALIDSVQLTYGNKNNGTLSVVKGVNVDAKYRVASDAVLNVGGVVKVCLYAASAKDKVTNGQVRIQRFRIYYRYNPTTTANECIETEAPKAVKVIRNGQLYIRKGNREYTVLGL